MVTFESEAERLLALVRQRPWRDVLAAETRRDPARFADITAPGGAAALSLLPLHDGEHALVVGDPWGRLAVPLARRAAVCALLPTLAEAELLACVAAQEGVSLCVCVGAVADPPVDREHFDLILLVGPTSDLRGIADLLSADGRCYASGDSLDELRTAAADADLTPIREYVCFPDASRPRNIVPLVLVEQYRRTHAADAEGPAEFAVVMRRSVRA